MRFAIALLISAAFCSGLAPRASANPASTEDEVLAADKARMDALVNQDWATLKKILADDVVYCHSGGNVQTKEQYLVELASGSTRYYKVDTEWSRPHVVGENGRVQRARDVLRKGGAKGSYVSPASRVRL
jgi:hypothetical protein